MIKSKSHKYLFVIAISLSTLCNANAERFPLSKVSQIDSSKAPVSVLPSLGANHPLSQRTSHASEVQLNPLQSPITIEFESQAVLVGTAVDSVAAALGYTFLKSGNNVSTQTINLLNSNLPLVHRKFINLPAAQVLRSLSGPGFVPVVDHVSRLITFDPIPLFAKTGNYARQEAPMRSILGTSNANIEEELVAGPVIVASVPKMVDMPLRQQDRKMKSKRPVTTTVASKPVNELSIVASKGEWVEVKTKNTASVPMDVRSAEIIQARSFAFKGASTSIKGSEQKNIDSILSRFESDTDVIVVTGCSAAGLEQENVALKRANSIREAFVAKGVENNRIKSQTCLTVQSLRPIDMNSAFVDLKRL